MTLIDLELKVISTKLYKKISTPPNLLENDNFRIRVAISAQELSHAQALRHEVFNVARGKAQPGIPRLDSDQFDAHCLHLIVEEKTKDRVVGTYRLQSSEAATRGVGFYSEHEFITEGLQDIADNALEAGRSCVSEEYRTGSVLGMLWAGIAEAMNRSQATYLFGCVSVDTIDAAVGWGLYRRFVEEGRLSEKLTARPKPEYILPPANGSCDTTIPLPPLLKGYLRLGSKICGEPALDKEFGSIDFLVLLDTADVPERFRRHFKFG